MMHTPAVRLALGQPDTRAHMVLRNREDWLHAHVLPTPTHLTISLDMDVPADSAAFTLPLAQALHPALGVAVEIDLGYGADMVRVFSGVVVHVENNLTTQRVVAHSPVQRLLHHYHSHIFEDCTSGEIVRHLAAEARVQTVEIADGSHIPFLVVNESRAIYAYLLDLARRSDVALYCDAQGRLVFQRRRSGTRTHTLAYGEDLLAVQLMPTSSNKPCRGTVKTLGLARAALDDDLLLVGLGDAVQICAQIRAVTHHISKQAGFTTRLRFEERRIS
ncbi:MAG: hypothetical protein OHK0046_41970 [Anaerolineae bacterium]